jgi:hypothetical protein
MNATELNDLLTKMSESPRALLNSPGTKPHGSTSGNGSLELPPTVNPLAIYILGPMRGHKKYNFPAFYEMAAKLRDCGYTPVNPAELDRLDGFNVDALQPDHDFTTYPEGMDAEQVVRRDLKAIMSCAGYVALPGYEKSKGATAEKAVFDWRGAKRLEYFSVHQGDGPFLQIANDTAPVTPKDETNPKDLLGLKKAPLRLVPWVSIVALARVMKLGAVKYGEKNWRQKKPRASIYFEAALRHLLAYDDGQDIDPESGESHLAHVMANMAILLDAKSCDCLLDDRAFTGEVIKALDACK